jgi:hypothetical protein
MVSMSQQKNENSSHPNECPVMVLSPFTEPKLVCENSSFFQRRIILHG